ncbi:MAG: hypothetical protein ACTSWX_16165 [Promethearchaeota archaeon]
MDHSKRKDFKAANSAKSSDFHKRSKKSSKKKSRSSHNRNIIRETKFVTLNSTNIQRVKEYFETIAPNLFNLFAQTNNYVLYQFEGKSYDIFLVPTIMSKIVKKLSKNLPLMHAGIHLGYMRPKRTHSGYVRAFFLSYEGGLFIYNFILNNHPELLKQIQTIELNSKGEKSFLYGSNIEFENVISKTANLVKKKLIFVFNQEKQYLGIALLLVKQAGKSKPTEPGQKTWDLHSRSQNFTVSLINLIDAGYYLRRGG